MILYFIASLALLAILVDVYIYRRTIRRHTGKAGRRAYIVSALAIDLIVVAALALFRRYSDGDSQQAMHMIMWAFVIFFASFAPKVLYFIFSLLDYPVKWIRGRRSHVFGYIGTVLGVILLVMMLWGMTFGRSRIEVNRVEIASEKLPEAFDGLRVVLFADVHMGNLMNRDRMLQNMVDSINALQPDVVVQAGDIVNLESSELDARAMEILSQIRSRYGVYAVLGNHDLGVYISDTSKVFPAASVNDLIAKQEAMGWHMMFNSTEYIRAGNDSIAVSGIDFPAHDPTISNVRESARTVDLEAAYSAIPDGTYDIMISHTPLMWPKILEWGKSDLTLSGHVHAMQMKFGMGRWMWSPAKIMYPHWSGLYSEAGKYLYVNDGIGYVMYPMRINARPEITLFTIRRK